jgi:nitrite reductase (NADH) large subunit
VGAVSVGPFAAVARVELAIRRGELISERALRRFERSGELMSTRRSLPLAAWPTSALVCNCERVSKGELEAAITRGAHSVEALCEVTGAGRVCGSCKPLLAQMCGAETASPPASRASRVVLVSSVIAALITLLGLLIPAPPFAVSVQGGRHIIDQLFRDPLLKQATGFGIVGLSLLGLVLSVRRRVRFARRGSFVVYRALHTCLGLLALMALVAHTGMRLGQNLNFALVSCFLGAALVGSGAGVVTALEAGDSSAALVARTLRPWLQTMHLFLCWPLPLLVGLHILAVYYF